MIEVVQTARDTGDRLTKKCGIPVEQELGSEWELINIYSG